MATASPSTPRSGAVTGCGRRDCDERLIEPVDVVCRTHGAVLVLSNMPPRTRYLLGVLACALAWVAFFAGPAMNTGIPVYLALAAAGAAIVITPLRLFPVAGRAIAIGWALSCAVAPVLRPGNPAFTAVLTTIALAVMAGWALRLSRTAAELNKMADSTGGAPGAALVATCLGTAIAAVLLRLATGGHDPVRRLPSALGPAFGWSAGLALGAAILALAGFGAVLGSSGWARREDWLIAAPRRPGRLAGPRITTRSRSTNQLDRFVDSLSRVTSQLLLSVLDILIYLLYYRALRIIVALTNWLLMWLIAMAWIAVRAVRLLVRAAWTATRVVLVPAVGLLAAAAALLAFAAADVDYVRSGSVGDIARLAGYAIEAYVLLTLAWTALSARPPSGLSAAIIDLTGPTLAITIVLVVIGGWGFGILGAFGWGPFHIGWLTLGGTSLVVAVMLIRALRRRGIADVGPDLSGGVQ